MTIIGYFVDADDEILASTVFVAFVDGGRYGCYCPVGLHSELDPEYLLYCKEIKKVEYIEASRGLYTPESYL